MAGYSAADRVKYRGCSSSLMPSSSSELLSGPGGHQACGAGRCAVLASTEMPFVTPSPPWHIASPPGTDPGRGLARAGGNSLAAPLPGIFIHREKPKEDVSCEP